MEPLNRDAQLRCKDGEEAGRIKVIDGSNHNQREAHHLHLLVLTRTVDLDLPKCEEVCRAERCVLDVHVLASQRLRAVDDVFLHNVLRRVRCRATQLARSAVSAAIPCPYLVADKDVERVHPRRVPIVAIPDFHR